MCLKHDFSRIKENERNLKAKQTALICLKVRSGQWDTKNIYHAKPRSYSQLHSKLLLRFHICACLPTINALSDGAFADGSILSNTLSLV